MQETSVDSWVGKIRWRRNRLPTPVFLGFPCGLAGKRIHPQCVRPEFDPWVGKIPWRREGLSTPIFWLGELHGLYSLWGCKESDTTKWFSLSSVKLQLLSMVVSHFSGFSYPGWFLPLLPNNTLRFPIPCKQLHNCLGMYCNHWFLTSCFLGDSDGKEYACNAGDAGSVAGSGRSPGEREWQPTPVFWPGESHGQRNLVGYSP